MLQMRAVRDLEQESWEQRRYALLEQLYLLTGENCERAVSPEQIETELDTAAAIPAPLIEDLVRLGYVRPRGTGKEICLAEKGVKYLQRDAWRRRSVRD